MIKDHCVENNIIDEVEEKPIAETAEIVRLKLDFEREERQLACEEAQKGREAAEDEGKRAREAAEAEAQKARDAERALQDAQFAEAEKSRELRLAELKE